MASAAGWTNIGNRRVRNDDVGNPTVETSAIVVEQPSGYVFSATDDEDDQLQHPVTGDVLTTAASFACFADIQSGADGGFINWVDSVDGHADVAEDEVMDAL